MSVASKPSSRIDFLSCADDKPNPFKVSSASFVGFNKPFNIALSCVDANAAFVPVLDIAAKAAPTSLNETPIFDATGKTEPIAPASSSDDNLPSLTAATKTSVASVADRFSFPKAFIAEVAKSATIRVSPRPTALAFRDASKTSIASEPLRPADVIKKSACAASLALLPVSAAIVLAATPIA